MHRLKHLSLALQIHQYVTFAQNIRDDIREGIDAIAEAGKEQHEIAEHERDELEIVENAEHDLGPTDDQINDDNL